jgi:transcription-repair coupling factor (superfamily II helicase)
MIQNQENISTTQLFNAIRERASAVDCSGLTGATDAYLIASLYRQDPRPMFVVVATPKKAQRLIDDLRFFAHRIKMPVIYFPPYNILPFKFLSYHNETAAERIAALYRMIVTTSPPVVVTTAGALIQKVIPKKALTDFAELLLTGEEIDRERLIEKLVDGGYTRAMVVEEPGDFCVRGGILDIFSPLYQEPVRIEFFGEMVESLRFFSAATQRSRKHVDEIVILPAKETILKRAELDMVISGIRRQAAESQIPAAKVRELVQRIKHEGIFPGIESLTPIIYEELDLLFDYLSAKALCIQIETGELEKAARELTDTAQKNYEEACQERRLCVHPNEIYLSWEEYLEINVVRMPLSLNTLALYKQQRIDQPQSGCCTLTTHDNQELGIQLKESVAEENPLGPLAHWVTTQKEEGNLVLFVTRTSRQAERLTALLKPYGIILHAIDGFPEVSQNKGMLYVCQGTVAQGFVWPRESLAVITEEEIFGTRTRRPKSVRRKVRTELLAVEELTTDDLVVHSEHGIGRYMGLVKLSLHGSKNDYLLIQYKEDDKLYLPVERMNMVQKYMGVDGVQPILDKMGGKSWNRVKRKVKKSAEKIAGELLKLYAARRVQSGHAFGSVDTYFKNFEAGFAYEETRDQLKAIEDVLMDMRSPNPMDRLICGDVGYGKTEVALRASFLAVSEAKQVALLVPTTVLAEQHFDTFRKRFERYPIQVACLSRFRATKEQRAIVNGLKDGTIDIVIGTHRLLQKDVGFRDLGLLVLDEEQRFGVKHKERLKQIRKSVDVLALTATPIPRTLHLSLMGIRDISIIATPPEDRHPIRTYVSEFDDAIVSEAVRKELNRGGQIFFVHNNIQSIERMAAHLGKLVPEARLDVAHGRMGEEELERVMLNFIKRRIDMLVCTTIIESGLDISSANTILVNRADRFGLAQIYQLRGRVGRSDDQAYAYLFIPSESSLTKEAKKRLKVLMEHSDLGSGFQIAMSDLKIRGGGTILGASQSGHIAAVGYDMFLKLMEESIAELKGQPLIEGLEPEISIPMSAFISEDYIIDIDQRLAVYRRLAKMDELKQITELKHELSDRFGPPPGEAQNLMLKIMLKILSIKAGIKKLDLIGKRLLLQFSEAHQMKPFGIVEMVTANAQTCKFTPDHILRVDLAGTGVKSHIAQSKNILIEIAQHVNS